MFVVGQIMGTHGIKGELKVKQLTDFSERFAVGNTLYMKSAEGEVETLKVAESRQTNKGWLIQFKGLESINDAEYLNGQMIYITEKEQTPLNNHEYYYHQIIGCKVVTDEGEEIGFVDTILAPGANDVWVVKNKEGKEFLIPYIKDVVVDVNVDEKIVKIKLLEGLLD